MARSVNAVTALGQRPADVSAPGVVAWAGLQHTIRTEELACEAPLEIRLAGESVAVTMRTPGQDIDLVSGFLVTEGIIPSMEEVASIGPCQTTPMRRT